MFQIKNKQQAFTLLEILLVIGIIAVLAGIVIMAINPSRQLAQVRNTQRRLNINEIDKALKQYYIDNHSYPTSSITTTLTEICNTGNATSTHNITCTNLADLSFLVPTYLTAIPTDPQATSTTGYMVMRSETNKIALSASASELEQIITIGNIPPTDYSCGDPTNPDCWSIQSPNSLVWSTEELDTPADSTTDGLANTLALMALDGSYPAAEYCYNLTEDNVPVGTWYLPSQDELNVGLTAYLNQYNLGNTTWGGFVDNWDYWSSSEYLSTQTYRAVASYSFIGEYVYTGSNLKSSTYPLTRCLR